MGSVRVAVDAAADFVAPFLHKGVEHDKAPLAQEASAKQLVEAAISHLQAINIAEQAQDPNAPYDGSLVGVVYGLVDFITSRGILPFLSAGVVFSQRPQSVLRESSLPPVPSQDDGFLPKLVEALLPILEQTGTGVQPLVNQRILPDLVAAIAELAFSPCTSSASHSSFEPRFEKTLVLTATSRLFPILTTYLQQDLPPWLRQRLSKALAMVPLRVHGVRHTIEFISLSYLHKNSKVPEDAAGSLSQIPIPLEAITHAGRLLASPPSGMSPEDWFSSLAPQLWSLLDGEEGIELSKGAGQVIAGGILNRKSTGAPGAVGWELFASPLIRAINPSPIAQLTPSTDTREQAIVEEQNLLLALKRLAVIVTSYGHPGLLKRLLNPVLLAIWGLLVYGKSRPSLDAQWKILPRTILSRYMVVCCDPRQIDRLMHNMFWDGESSWTFGPGSQGGVEVRRRSQQDTGVLAVGGLLARLPLLNERIRTIVSLLDEANIDDDIAGVIFVNTTKRWLSTEKPIETKPSLTNEEPDPLKALTDAKLSEALATKFQDKFARSPQHIIELMATLLNNYVDECKTKAKKLLEVQGVSRVNLGNIVKPYSTTAYSSDGDAESEELISFALSILTTVLSSPDFKPKTDPTLLFLSLPSALEYMATPLEAQSVPIPALITNAAANLLLLIRPSLPPEPSNPRAQNRTTLQTALKNLTSSEPPNRTWALTTLRQIIHDPASFPLIDIPSTAHMILAVSIADRESYVHTAAIPVLVDLTIRAPNPTLRIVVDAFLDVDELTLRLKKEKEVEEALDFRLRVGEVLHDIVLSDLFWATKSDVQMRYNGLTLLTEAVLSLASRRGQRHKTLAARNEMFATEQKVQEEGEAAWGGPIPNLLDPEGQNPAEQADRDALFRIVQGWENTGIEEDVRIRTSALSILGTIFEKRLELLSQVTVDAGLQMVLLIMAMEGGAAKGILRRSTVLVVMGVLKGMDALLEEGKNGAVGMGSKQTEEVERVMKWARDEDEDDLVKSHAESVLEGIEIWRMKKVYKIRDEGFTLGANLGSEGNLRGLDVHPLADENKPGRQGLIVEEIE
ncbi:hypothetical protein P154DRAFT_25846 [Amniculicola lignicola CBS 123094]|uniref:RNA polymerase II assembly factor Rtp1 C-terminal domain-containing protein n=1 Tax=Amniculicola lignicola CBS 123094 TaxID=1392246 RepID=A0A6A5W329_9PLEO|nr:hypothetical protein P154DRAFT_25846 [Amniculicola lignicola CBS 123094]